MSEELTNLVPLGFYFSISDGLIQIYYDAKKYKPKYIDGEFIGWEIIK